MPLGTFWRNTLAGEASFTIDRLDPRQRDRGAGPHIVEIDIRIVLRHQPYRQPIVLLCNRPQRIAALDGVGLGTRDAMRGEKGLLQMVMIIAPRSFELRCADLREV